MKACWEYIRQELFEVNSATFLYYYRRILYGVLFLDLVLNIPTYAYVLPVEGFTPFHGGAFWSVFSRPFLLLYFPPWDNFHIYFIGAFVLALLAALYWVNQRIWAVLIFYAFRVFCLKTTEMNNGGHDLMNLLLFYNMFHGLSKSPAWAWVHVTSVWLARLEICAMYLISLIYKLQGDYWLTGEALALVIHNDYYMSSWAKNLLMSVPWMWKWLNYGVLFYPLLFASCVWFKGCRRWLLIIGIAFHLSIWFALGLYDFAWYVMAGYGLFIRVETSQTNVYKKQSS